MRILIIRNYPSYMDVRHNTYNIQEIGLAKALTRKGHQCDVLFWTNKNEETIFLNCEGKKIYIFYKKGINILQNTIFLNCNGLFEKYDILQPCEYNQIEAWLLASKFSDRTVIYHGPYYSHFNKKYNLMSKLFDIFFLNRYKNLNTPFIVKSELAQSFLLQKGINNIVIAGVGMDQSMLNNYPDTEQIEFQKQMLSDNEYLKILYIGRLEKRRNILFLIEMFYQLKRKINSIRLYIIGTGSSKYIDKVWKRANELGLKDDIRYVEKLEQKFLSSIYQQADFFILPTEYEIFGMVLLEAMNYETVCITNTNGGSSMLIKNGLNGVIIDKMIPIHWAEIVYNIACNKKLMNEIKIAAGKTIRENFTWDNIVTLFIETYEKKLNSEFVS